MHGFLKKFKFKRFLRLKTPTQDNKTPAQNTNNSIFAIFVTNLWLFASLCVTAKAQSKPY
jgi:hypothetical protein